MKRIHLLLPCRSLGLAAVTLLLAAAGPSPLLLRYERQAVLQGEWWRPLTSHLVHASQVHLRWDLLALLATGFLFEPAMGRRYWLVTGVSAGVIGAGLPIFEPALRTYCGLSGVLSALWIAGALSASRTERHRDNPLLANLYLLCAVLCLAKVAWESAAGAPVFAPPDRLGGRVVPLAHALGALAGFLVFLLSSGASGPPAPVTPPLDSQRESRLS